MPHPGPSLCGGPDGRGFQRVCKFSRVFEHVKAPKSTRKVEKKNKKKKNNNPLENNRALRLTGLGPNNNPLEINRALRLTGLGPKNKIK